MIEFENHLEKNFDGKKSAEIEINILRYKKRFTIERPFYRGIITIDDVSQNAIDGKIFLNVDMRWFHNRFTDNLEIDKWFLKNGRVTLYDINGEIVLDRELYSNELCEIERVLKRL